MLTWLLRSVTSSPPSALTWSANSMAVSSGRHERVVLDAEAEDAVVATSGHRGAGGAAAAGVGDAGIANDEIGRALDRARVPPLGELRHDHRKVGRSLGKVHDGADVDRRR